VIARAIAAPRVFALGSQHAPTDTEGYVLEELLEAATGMSSSEIISADGVPPFLTRYFDQAQPDGLVAGLRLDGGRIADLDPAVLDLVGNAGGMTSSSDDLAEYTTVWHTVDFGLREVTDTLVDAANDHANPLAARGICCRDGEVTTIVATGHAFGWSALIASDLELGVSVGVVAGRDISEADLEALLDVVIAEIAGTTSG
jgi:CubicO group peptidase (beta-lactamase class C family)